jgi:hypothetical protein
LNNSIRLILKDFPLTKIEKTYKIEWLNQLDKVYKMP